MEQKPSYPGWEAQTESRTAFLSEDKARALAATLDCDSETFANGSALPPLWQWIYFTPEAPMRDTGPDGHPRKGGFYPPIDLPRRMFAGANMRFLNPLRLGSAAERQADVIGISSKSGRTGRLVFVKVRYRYVQDGALCIEEVQDIVYREEGGQTPATIEKKLPALPADAWCRTIRPDPVLLFRISALTFNSHRIHYDRPYATEAEGYPGLVVHGPLTAILLAELARHNDPRTMSEFSFKALAPLFDLHPFRIIGQLDGDTARLYAERPDAAPAMEAEARFL